MCFGRCYPGGGSLIDSRIVLEPVRQLVVASVPPLEEANGSPRELEEEDGTKESEMDEQTRDSDEDLPQQVEPVQDSEPSPSVENE